MAATGILSLAFTLAWAQTPSDTAVFFEEKIRPLLAARCFGCHGDAKVSGLRLDSREGMLHGGRLGPAMTPGKAESSLLMQAVTHTHERLKMPPAERLKPGEIESLRAWIQAGANWPETKAAESTPGRITPQQRKFWSFVPLKAAAGSIDDFIAAKQKEAGVKPMGRADQRVLIRRAFFDLTGLPPQPADVDAFVSDSAPGAFARLVDRLLASRHFGERWGRYWLDVARYAEDDVLGLSQEKYPNGWRYRDWVIEAMNRDLPYDTFIKAQIAGDLMEADFGMDLRPALGFFGLGPWHYAISPPPQARADERHDRIDTLTRGVLGLTVACARCHDHKFDPITMKDYYGLGGVFASTEYREYPLAPAETVEAYDRHQQKVKDLEKRIKDLTNRQREAVGERLARDTQPYLTAARSGAANDGLKQLILDRWKQYLAQKEHDHPFLGLDPEGFGKLVLDTIAEKKQIDQEKQAAVERSKPKNAAKTRLPNGFETYDEFCPGCDIAVRALDRDRYVLWNDLFREAPAGKPGGLYYLNDDELTQFLSPDASRDLAALRAELEGLKKSSPAPYPFLHGIADKARAANLRIHLRGDPYSLGQEVPRRFLEVLSPAQLAWTEGSGRLPLADAVMSQPIAARVAANRVWMRLTGRPLVASPSNFGRFGERPSHPELLEYLAARLVERKWSLKALIREIMLSGTYQRSSAHEAANDARDGANKWFWRANRRRLDAESLRDSILAAAGTLDETVGGASAELSAGFRRRAVYGRVSRFQLNESLLLFDFPNPGITSEKRDVTHVPLQRLYFLNSDFVNEQAEALARRIEKESPAGGRLSYAYRLLFSRDPAAAELKFGKEFLAAGDWKQLAQVLLSTNEFLFVD